MSGSSTEHSAQRPEMRLTGLEAASAMDGNIFNILGKASRRLKEFGLDIQAKEMYGRVTTQAKSYDEALLIISEYVQTELSTPSMAPAGEKEDAGQKLVYVCAPLRGEVERNVEAARLFAKEIFARGDIPLCPHLLFPSIANPKDPAEDAKALAMCMKLIESCHVLNVYGQPTEGMRAEIEHAQHMGIPVHEVAPAKKKAKGKGSRGPSR